MAGKNVLIAALSGRFFVKGRESATRAITHDRQAAARLWKISEELCGLTGRARTFASEAA
jgi:hypothetical protein